VGLLVAGILLDDGWTYGQVMALLGIGQVVAAVLAFFAYPETAHQELEALNPEDRAVSPSVISPIERPQPLGD
jgi:hypothetical protein